MKYFFSILLFYLLTPGFSQECLLENKSFKTGERVDYTIYYYLAGMWVSAGDVYFTVDTQKIVNTPY